MCYAERRDIRFVPSLLRVCVMLVLFRVVGRWQIKVQVIRALVCSVFAGVVCGLNSVVLTGIR